MRTFELHRLNDETGISGTGIVAQGVEFDDRTCALRWTTDYRSTALYDDIKTLEKIHGHAGKTKIFYTGEPFERGMMDCCQDSCENVPFASVGGLEKRGELKAPHYITPKEQEKYLRGYAEMAEKQYGKDWRTCSFGWTPAITIP